MDKIKKMAHLVKEYERASNALEHGIAAMFGATEESEEAFEKMWDYAKKSGFVNPYTRTITERPILKIYANYGVPTHEKETFYTYANNQSEIYEEIYVEIPKGFKVYDQENGTGIVLSAEDGYDYFVDDLLKNVGGSPAFVYVGKDGGHRAFKCRVLEAI